MEISGVAHIVLAVNRFDECGRFYDRLMPELGLQVVYRTDGFVYYVGGKTALGIRRAEGEHAGERYDAARPGLDHICLRARSREDVDALYPFVQELGARIVRAPEDGPWAPGYYSLSFLDPEGIRLEVNHVPGKGLFSEGAAFEPAPEHPLAGRGRS